MFLFAFGYFVKLTVTQTILNLKQRYFSKRFIERFYCLDWGIARELPVPDYAFHHSFSF